MIIRRASWEDCDLLFDWVNEASVRDNSFSQNGVKLQDHLKWFESKLNSPDSVILILEQGDKPIGQVRFDKNSDLAWEIDYSVDVGFRGKGYAKVLLSQGISFMEEKEYMGLVVGKVKTENMASIKVFRFMSFDEKKQGGIYVFQTELES